MPIKIGIPFSGCENISEIPCTREDEAVAFACGMYIGGDKNIEVFMQDNGFLLALDVILGLAMTYGLELCINVKSRSEPLHHFSTGVFWYNTREMFLGTDRAYKNHLRTLKR